jgi:hypothetical protein
MENGKWKTFDLPFSSREASGEHRASLDRRSAVAQQVKIRHPIPAVGSAREGVIAQQCCEDAFADVRSQAEQPLRLSTRQAQTRHLGEFAANALEQGFP